MKTKINIQLLILLEQLCNRTRRDTTIRDICSLFHLSIHSAHTFGSYWDLFVNDAYAGSRKKYKL